jgi:hypothetical protein
MDSQDKEYLEDQQTIANFLSSCLAIEKLLQEVPPLTDLQLDTITTAIQGVHTNVVVWKSKVGKPLM